MNQFMKILVVILFGLLSWNGIQVFGATPETEVSYTSLDHSSENGQQPSSLQPVQELPENFRLNSHPDNSWTLVSLRPQDFYVQSLPVYRNGQDKLVHFLSMNNCFSWYKTVMSSEMNGEWACSSFHCVSVSGRSIVFAQRKIII